MPRGVSTPRRGYLSTKRRRPGRGPHDQAGICMRSAQLPCTGGDTFIEARVQAVRLKLRPLAAVRLTLAL